MKCKQFLQEYLKKPHGRSTLRWKNVINNESSDPTLTWRMLT